MAPPAFGFSVGDFISAIGLITKICKALQATGGAASEYQHVILELHSLERVLIHLAALEPTDENANHVNAIRGMALACQFPLREFLTKLEKYEVSLGPFAARKTISGAGRKAKWAVCMSEEVSKLRAIVAAKVLSINLLLSTHTSQTVSRVELQGRKYHSEHQNGLKEIKKRVEEVREEVTKGFKEARTNDITRIKVESKINTRMRSLEVNTECNTSQLEAISSSTQNIRSSIVSLRGVGEQLKQFLSSFPVEVRDLLRAILQTNFQIYNLLHAQTVAQSPTLLLQDNIRFEDALGVVRELPYEWFRDWEPFEGFLRAKFKNLPGESKVVAGQYRIIDAKRHGHLISNEEWNKSVFPGSSISMSMIISQVRRQPNRCLRLSCGGKNITVEDRTQRLVCRDCGLKYYHKASSSSLDDSLQRITLLDEGEEIAKQQAEEDLQLYGPRLEPLDSDEAHDLMDIDLSNKLKRAAPFPFIGEDERPQKIINIDQDDTAGYAQPPRINWNAGENPIDAWLDESTKPLPSILSLTQERQEREAQERQMEQQEMQEIEVFRQVHLEADPLEEHRLVPEQGHADQEEELEFGARIYYRNIMDKFPQVPHYLARRLAEGNQYRAERLRKLFKQKDIHPTPQGDSVNRSPDSPVHGYSITRDQRERDFELDLKADLKVVWTADPETDQAPDLVAGFGWWQRYLDNMQKGLETSDIKDSQSDSFWLGGSISNHPSAPASRSSSRNSSLRGDTLIFDPSEQNMVFNDIFNDAPSPPPNHPASSVPFNLPPPPVPLGEQRVFDCDICGRNVRVQRRREWKKHVLQDIRPYMCTFPDCLSPHETYSLQSDFLRHEVQIHLRSYHDVDVGNSDGFESLSKMGLVGEELKGPSRCPFCTEGLPVEKLELGRHLGRHMEEIAFVVVSKPYEEWKFYDDSASEKSSQPRKTSYSRQRAGIVRSRPNYGATVPNQMMASSSSKITSSTQKTNKCYDCNKNFSGPDALRRHMWIRHNKK